MARKVCSRCKVPKLIEDFHRNKVQADGRQNWCKVCVREYQNQRRTEDPEQYRDYQRQWRERNPGYYRRYVRKPPQPLGSPRVVFDD